MWNWNCFSRFSVPRSRGSRGNVHPLRSSEGSPQPRLQHCCLPILHQVDETAKNSSLRRTAWPAAADRSGDASAASAADFGNQRKQSKAHKTLCDPLSGSRRETREVWLQVEEAVGPVKSFAPGPFNRHAKPRPSSKMLHEGAHHPHHLLNRSLKKHG